MKVLCFGSLNIDYTYEVPHFVTRGETLSAGRLSIFSGGKGLNQSIALARAGLAVSHAGAVGEDGGFLLAQLEEAGVDVSCVEVRKDVRTGHAIIQNDAGGDNCILLFGGANQTITREQADRTLDRFQAGDLLVLQNEINELAYIMEAGKARGLRIALNPAPMDGSVRELPLACADWLLLNEVEGAQLLGREPEAEPDGAALAQEIQAQVPGPAVVLTLGEGGSVYAGDGQTVFQRAFPVKAVDTTAAGDTYTGFFLAGAARGLPVEQAMELAARAAALAVCRKGAAPSIPTREEVLAFAPSRP